LPEPEASLNETLERLLGILTRRRWWALLPASGTIFATLIVLSLIPNRYSSEATLLVVQQQIPQRYVLPTTTTDIREALQATTQEVLSRTRLLQIIEEFGLYMKERKRLSPEGVLELMRRDIGILPLEGQSAQKDVNSFKISFISSNPQLAQEVTSKLTSLFIEQNLVTREHQATTTTNFLQEQLGVVKNKLAEAEEQVRSFKMQNLGELPEQQPGNLAILSGLQSQLQNTMSGLSRAQEQREYLKSLSGYRALTIEGDLARLKSERAILLERYTPRYAAVVKVNEKIAQTETLLKTLRDSPSPGTAQAQAEPLSTMGTDQDSSAALQLKSQLEANRLEIENLSREEEKLKAGVEQYQKRLNQTPVREQQLAGVLRNYDQLKQDYADLLNKESQSRMSADLEKRQEGQQFRMIDQPSLPTVPSSPNRVKISLGGAAAGVLLGLVLAFFVDSKDHSFRSEKDLSQRFSLPLVVGVPLISTNTESRMLTRKRAFEWVGATCLLLAVFAAELYEFYLYRHG
jgi:succinoglycan biosynthesis transport protein ExoP